MWYQNDQKNVKFKVTVNVGRSTASEQASDLLTDWTKVTDFESLFMIRDVSLVFGIKSHASCNGACYSYDLQHLLFFQHFATDVEHSALHFVLCWTR